jgi:hypothetical protein
LPDSHRNPFSFSQILIVEFAKSDRKNNHAAIVSSGNGFLLCAPIYEKYDDFGTPDAAVLLKKMGLGESPITTTWTSIIVERHTTIVVSSKLAVVGY